MQQIILLDMRTSEPLNTESDGTSWTIKSQYHKISIANFIRHRGGYGATGVIEYESDESDKK